MTELIVREQFPSNYNDYKLFIPLFIAHGIEAANKPMCLDVEQYLRIQKEDRLIWIVARHEGLPIGYSCHVIYVDRHFYLDGKIAVDDIWYVTPEFRNKGMGKALKRIGLTHCKEAGATKTTDTIRRTEHSHTMESLGYTQWGIRWGKTL